MKTVVFWGAIVCSLVDRYQDVIENCCLHIQGRTRGVDTYIPKYMVLHP